MKKILFSDRYGLTKAVLEGRKTQTRRIALHSAEDVRILDELERDIHSKIKDSAIVQYIIASYSRFKKYELVAVAQSLKDLNYDKHIFGDAPGWANKMFVSASRCKNWIQITDVRLERLQNITDADCLREGIQRWRDTEEYSASDAVRRSVDEMEAAGYEAYSIPGHWGCYTSPRKAYADLIDKVSGKGTWDKNPWVFVYDFVLYQGIK